MGVTIKAEIELDKEQVFGAIEEYVLRATDLDDGDIDRLNMLSKIASSKYSDPEGVCLGQLEKDARDVGLHVGVAEMVIERFQKHFPGMAVTARTCDDQEKPGMKLLKVTVATARMAPEEVAKHYSDALLDLVNGSVTVIPRHLDRFQFSFDSVEEGHVRDREAP